MTFKLPDTDTVLAALASAAELPASPMKGWERRVVRSESDGRCAYCLAPLDPLLHRKAFVNALVPVSLGGPAIRENRVLCCASCARLKGSTDLVAWPALDDLDPAHRARLLEARATSLLMARNHLTPHSPSVALPVVLDHLAARFEHPRFHVYAAQASDRGWIGWTPDCGADTALNLATGVLRWRNRARVLSRWNLTLFEVSGDAFLDAVWELIEHHAIVSPLSLDNLPPPPSLSVDWRNCWVRTFTLVSDLRRRHSRVDPTVAPSPLPVLSSSAQAKWKRKRDATRAQANHHRAWRQAQLELDRVVSEHKTGQLPHLDAEDLWDQAGAVLRLKAQALGVLK